MLRIGRATDALSTSVPCGRLVQHVSVTPGVDAGPTSAESGPDVSDGRWSWRPRRPPYVDIGIAMVFVALAISELVTYDTLQSALRHTLLSALPLATLAWRRQYPELVAAVVVLSTMVSNPTFEFTIVLSLVLCGGWPPQWLRSSPSGERRDLVGLRRRHRVPRDRLVRPAPGHPTSLSGA